MKEENENLAKQDYKLLSIYESSLERKWAITFNFFSYTFSHYITFINKWSDICNNYILCLVLCKKESSISEGTFAFDFSH